MEQSLHKTQVASVIPSHHLLSPVGSASHLDRKIATHYYHGG